MAASLVGKLPAPLRGGLQLICAHLTLVPAPACTSPLSPLIGSVLPSTGDVPTTMASPGDLAPWAGLAGFLLLLASLVAMWWRARTPHAPPIAG